MTRVGLKQLAQHVGLTESTVSRALNGYDDIAPATREHVRIAANTLGYRPNPTARRLATGRAETVAYMMPSGQSALSTPFVPMLLQGLGDALSVRRWDLLVVQSPVGVEGEAELDTLRKLIASGRVSGVVLSRPLQDDARIEFLKASGFPFIVHGRARDAAGYAWFDIDSRAAFRQAVDHLAGLGHRRIGMVSASTDLNFVQERLDGYLDGLTRNHLAVDSALTAFADLSDAGGRTAAAQLLAQPDPPTALLCTTDLQAIGALAAIRALGMRPGEDVSVIGYDGFWMGQHTDPPLTTLAQPQTDSGLKLGEMLLAIIDGGEPADFQILRQAELVRRSSDGPVKGPTKSSNAQLTEETSCTAS